MSTPTITRHRRELVPLAERPVLNTKEAAAWLRINPATLLHDPKAFWPHAYRLLWGKREWRYPKCCAEACFEPHERISVLAYHPADESTNAT